MIFQIEVIGVLAYRKTRTIALCSDLSDYHHGAGDSITLDNNLLIFGSLNEYSSEGGVFFNNNWPDIPYGDSGSRLSKN